MIWFVEEPYNEQNLDMKMCLLDFKVIGCFISCWYNLIVTRLKCEFCNSKLMIFLLVSYDLILVQLYHLLVETINSVKLD